MRTLHLLRHAKSSWDDPELDDRERPLAPRGRRASATIAAHLGAAGIRPDLVLCSPALRARQTLDLVAPGFGDVGPEVELDDSIYGAAAADLLARLQLLPEDAGTVLIVGHQPGIGDLAAALIGAGPGRERLGGKFPTAALASFAVGSPWSELEPGGGRLLAMVRPKQLQRR